MTREPIYAALFAKLSSALGVAGIVTVSRRLVHWNDVPSSQQPAMYMIQKGETAQPQPRGMPTKWTLEVDVYIYANSADVNVSPGSIMNPLLDALTAALAPPNPVENVQTLGGLVSNCWIEGGIQTDEGVLGGQSVAIVPIRILAT
jgi:hypothetical protein